MRLKKELFKHKEVEHSFMIELIKLYNPLAKILALWLRIKLILTKYINKMKKVIITNQQMELLRGTYRLMGSATRRKYRAILLAVVTRKIKAKLGFTFNTGDTVFLSRSEAIAAAFALDAGGYFAATPFADLALLVTQNTALSTAIQNVKLGVMGAEGAKIAAKEAVKATLDLALGYVNSLARADQVNAVEIITSAAMMVIGAKELNKQDFAVKQSTDSGAVILRSLAGKFANKRVITIYDWQQSNTPDVEASWFDLPSTSVANTMVIDLPLDKKVWFRKRTSTRKGGTSDWSPPLGITPV